MLVLTADPLPRLTLNLAVNATALAAAGEVGGLAADRGVATYAGGNGTSVLTFKYLVQPGDTSFVGHEEEDDRADARAGNPATGKAAGNAAAAGLQSMQGALDYVNTTSLWAPFGSIVTTEHVSSPPALSEGALEFARRMAKSGETTWDLPSNAGVPVLLSLPTKTSGTSLAPRVVSVSGQPGEENGSKPRRTARPTTCIVDGVPAVVERVYVGSAPPPPPPPARRPPLLSPPPTSRRENARHCT